MQSYKNTTTITSPRNPLVKRLVRLGQKRHRDIEQVFLIEGHKEIACAIESGIAIETIVYCPELDVHNASRVLLEGGGIPYIVVTPAVYAKIAYRQGAQGIIAVAKTPTVDINDLKLSVNPFVVVVEGVEKPGNLGALLRTADAAGVDAVILCDSAVDLYNPNVIRSSIGAVFTVGVFVMRAKEAIEWLANRQVQIVASSPMATDRYYDLDYTCPTAIVLGSEAKGLSSLWLNSGIRQVNIPMQGKMDSLNISTSGAILLYEILRQRQQ